MTSLLAALACAMGCAGTAGDADGSKDASDSGAGADTDTDTGDTDSARDTGDTDSAGDSGDDTAPDTGEPCDGDTGAVDGPDDDGDGFTDVTDGGDDCDDARDNVYPGAPEACDGLDQDCDGEAVPAGSCSEVGELRAAAWVSVVGDSELRWVNSNTASWGAGGDDGGWLHWRAYSDTDAYHTLFLAGRDLESSPRPGTGTWNGAAGTELLSGVVAGDVDGDGLGDFWQVWEPGAGPVAAYLLKLGPVPGSCGLDDVWDWADAVVQNTDTSFAQMNLHDAAADADGDGRADALVSLSPADSDLSRVYLVTGSALEPGSTLELTESFAYVTPYASGNAGGQPHFLPDLDGDGSAEMVMEAVCGDPYDGIKGVVLTGGSDLQVALAAGGGIDEVSTYLCPADGHDWRFSNDLETADDRAADVDGDGRPDLLLGHAPGTASEGAIVFVDMQGGAETPLEDRVLRELSTWATSATYAAGAVDATHFGDTPDQSWLALGTYGACLYNVGDIPLYGVAEWDGLPYVCIEDSSDHRTLLQDLVDLDGDGLPEWIWSNSNYQVDGVDVGRVDVVHGFDVPYDDPSKW